MIMTCRTYRCFKYVYSVSDVERKQRYLAMRLFKGSERYFLISHRIFQFYVKKRTRRKIEDRGEDSVAYFEVSEYNAPSTDERPRV